MPPASSRACAKDLRAIHAEYDPSSPQYDFLSPPAAIDKLDALLTSLLQKLNYDEASITAFLKTLRGPVLLETDVPGLPAGFGFPGSITAAPNHIPISYEWVLRFNGLMTAGQRSTLLNDPLLANVTGLPSYQQAIQDLFDQAGQVIVTGLPAGFAFPTTITAVIPIRYQSVLRFSGVMTEAQRTVLLDDTAPALATLYASGQLEASVPGSLSAFTFPTQIPIQYDVPNQLFRFTGLMTDGQRQILFTDSSLLVVAADPIYRNAIDELYQRSLAAVTSYQTAIEDLFQQSAAIGDKFVSARVTLAGSVTFPTDRPSLPLRYNQATQELIFIGLMSDAERLALHAAGNPVSLIDELFWLPRLAVKFFEPAFTTLLETLPPTVDFKAQLSADLSAKISYDTEQQLLRFAGIMSSAEQATLNALVLNTLPVETAYHAAVNDLASQPQAITLPGDRVWLTENELDVTLPANDTLAKRLAGAATKALGYLSRTLMANTVVQQCSAKLGLTEAVTRHLLGSYPVVMEPLLTYLIGIFAATSGAVNYSTLTMTFDGWFWATRTALLSKKWKATLAELKSVFVLAANGQFLQFASLPLDGTVTPPSIELFLRTGHLFKLRDSVPETAITLFEVLEKLGTYNTVAEFAADVERLNNAWPATEVEAFIGPSNVTYQPDYRLPETWEYLRRVFYFLDSLNASTATASSFAAAAMTDTHAKTLRELLRSKFGAETWLTLSAEIQDVLRERKRDALAAYLLAQQPANPPSGKWENTNDLYAYYLLDVEMCSCQLTSRMVLGAGGMQLLVHRCLMGLEPEVEVKADGATGDSAWRWWQWMSKYRVWEANRKVFLWPENWIAPELKKDRSSFFKDLENELLQNEVNQYNAEAAFTNYLEKVDGVAQLEIAGFYQEDDGDDTIVHVFGRTRGAEPHLYYYRRYDYHQWTPWEKVELDIQGDYLIPAVIANRLFLFWPGFTEVPDEAENSTVAIPNAGDNHAQLHSTKKRKSLRMAVSDYRLGKWSPKRVSKDFDVSLTYAGEVASKHYRFLAIDRSEIDGRFGIVYDGYSTSARPPEKGHDDNHNPSGNWNPTLAEMAGAFEIANCAGVPALADFPSNFSIAIQPEAESAGSQTDYLKWVELINRTDAGGPPDDFTLEVVNGFSNGVSFARLLERTPGLYHMSPSWHLSYFDKVLLDGSMLLSPFMVTRTTTPIGIGLPFFYNDKKRTFFTLPCLSIDRQQPAPAPKSDFIRAYYPEIKGKLRATEEAFEGLIRTWLKDFVVPPLGIPGRLALEKALSSYFPTDPAPYSDGQIKELMARLWMRSIHLYLGSEVLGQLRSSRYHFKNFYHWFVCDFLKLVANPLQGIPGLMRRETQLKNSGFRFKQTYQPTFLVVDPATEDFYPQEIVDFSPDGAYSSYNWELFFHAPLLIANALSRNQKFEEARDWYHYIFNPIGVESAIPGGSNMSRFWMTKPLFETTGPQYVQQRIDNILGMLKGNAALESQVRDWRTYAFEPHRIANYRTVAYQKTVVMNYLDNLIAWGDFLFRQDSMESINEATQLYVLAAEILGPRPKKTPPQAKPVLLSFNELESEFDAFSNAMVQVENLVPQLPGGGSGSGSAPLLPTLYFCVPQNDKMLGYWDTVADRLYKIRHCMNIEGVVRQLALFEPEIDPGALVKAVAGGADITSALADLNAPLPFYRFNTLLQKANEICGDVKALGGALLGALEKKDAEALSLLRQRQEIQVLEATKAVREKQIEEAKENLEGIKKSKIVTETRRNYYRDIERLSSQEKLHLDKLAESHKKQEIAAGLKTIAGVLSYLPDIDLGASGFGGTPLAKFKIGGLNLGQAVSIAGDVVSFFAQIAANDAIMASVNAGNERRWAEWQLQLRLAERELDQLDQQIASGKLRIAIAEKELANHLLQIDNARATDEFMRSKYTNLELYQWQVGRISGTYFQSYKLAYDLAKRAERCFRFELGLQDSSYISFGYWDSLKKGLLSGERLQLDLRRLETAYLEQNRRSFELTKHVSLGLLDPLALVKLRETGRCFFQLPEEIFDLDYPGHYFRQIKSVSLTLPCVTGPYTTISCTLRLLKNAIRINTANGENGYPHNTDEEGLPSDDDRFVQSRIPFKAIAASSAQNDSGVFELNFQDQRYLPFEGAGAISDWSLELFSDLPSNNPDPANPDFGKPLRQFDYGTISDAIVHVKYTAREDAGPFKNGAVAHLREYFSQDEAAPSLRMLNLRHDFPTQWYRFLNPANAGGENIFEFEISPALFPFRDGEKTLKVNMIWLLARCTDPGNYDVVLAPPFPPPPPLPTPDPNKMTLSRANQYGGLHFQQRDTAPAIEILPTGPPVKWQLKMTRPGGGNLMEDPTKKIMEVEDIILVLGYEWDL